MSDKSTTIYLVRHGESEYNVLGLNTGHSDPPLTENGRQQVHHAKQNLKHVDFDDVFSSDLQRAFHTAEIIYETKVPETNRRYNLRERDFGSLDSKPNHVWDRVNEKKSTMKEHEKRHYKHVPDMESDHEVAQRLVNELTKIAENNLGKTLLVVTHGGAIRTTLMQITGWNETKLPAGSIKNAGYAQLEYDPGLGFKVIQISGLKL